MMPSEYPIRHFGCEVGAGERSACFHKNSNVRRSSVTETQQRIDVIDVKDSFSSIPSTQLQMSGHKTLSSRKQIGRAHV